MSKILFVEDDEALGFALEFSLKDEGYDVSRVQTVSDAKIEFSAQTYDLILLDVNLPDGSGYEFCKYIREGSAVPIIFLTALDDEANVVMGLELGANDYLAKPFGVRELMARIRVQLRNRQEKGHYMISGNIKADLKSATVYKRDGRVALTSLEYKLLILLMENSGTVLNREKILLSITSSGSDFFEENTLSVYIKRLRDKIEDDPQKPVCILTQRGLGYMWNVPVRSE